MTVHYLHPIRFTVSYTSQSFRRRVVTYSAFVQHLAFTIPLYAWAATRSLVMQLSFIIQIYLIVPYLHNYQILVTA